MCAQMSEERDEFRPAAGAAALHGADGDVEEGGGLGDGVALHVDEDQGGPLIGREGAQGGQELPVEVLALRGRLGGLVGLQKALQAVRVVEGEVLREAALRALSRQAFTVMRCSQVVTADSPRKVWAAR